MTTEELREERIREYVSGHDLCSEGEVIRHLVNEQICSKDTARASIKKLIEKGDLLLKPDKRKNNKTHHLSINSASDFVKIGNNISDLEKKIGSLKVREMDMDTDIRNLNQKQRMELNDDIKNLDLKEIIELNNDIKNLDSSLKMELYTIHFTIPDESSYKILTDRVIRAMLVLFKKDLQLRQIELACD